MRKRSTTTSAKGCSRRWTDVMGPGAEEQLNLFALAMKVGLTANQIKATMFAYPRYASDLGYMV